MSEKREATLHKRLAEGLGECSPEDDRNFLARLAEYVKYLYEEENARRDVLNNTTKLYLGSFAFVVGVGLVKVAAIEKLPPMISVLFSSTAGGKFLAILITVLFVAVAGLFCISFLFTISVLRMWKRERLCDPQKFVFRSTIMPDEARLLSAIVADYVVATNRNFRINEQKARLLAIALRSFIYAFITFIATWMMLHTIEIFGRYQ
ncbi:MAG: hypothetical protein QNJ97_13160 [Myxococcota bacterium]|nr:hypothetical protein [Myxococcota bacterium]